MIVFLKEWVLSFITLIIFIILLEILLPSGKLKKFINLVSGFILIITIIKPLVGNFDIKTPLKDFEIINSNYVDKKSLEQNSKVMEEAQMNQVIEVYRNKLTATIKERLEAVDEILDVEVEIIINEDNISGNLGEIRKVFLKLKIAGKNPAGKAFDNHKEISPIPKVEKIEIKVGDKETEEVFDEKIKKEVETIISNLLQIKGEDIMVSMEKSRGE